jgi:hypothetical protein
MEQRQGSHPTTRSHIRAATSFPATKSVRGAAAAPRFTPDGIRHYLRQLGLLEPVVIHEQDYHQFMDERGITQLGQGGEASVYFLRGHAVKVANQDSAPAALREIAHMLHLNKTVGSVSAMGERAREDWPSLLWVYILSEGSLSIGMKPFDAPEAPVPGATLYEILEEGPALDRQRTLEVIRGLGQSLVYAHRNGIIHHDLKPANIYIPSDPAKCPIIFDLAQALWQQLVWGRKWLYHEHNNYYWYNGTYRYMHLQRRRAHLAAVAKSEGIAPSEKQLQVFRRYRPGYYDDVASFARILYDIVKSMNTWLSDHDRAVLRKFYRHLMSLRSEAAQDAAKAKTHETGFLQRVRHAFGSAPAQPAPVPSNDPPAISMEQVLPPLEAVLHELQ